MPQKTLAVVAAAAVAAATRPHWDFSPEEWKAAFDLYKKTSRIWGSLKAAARTVNCDPSAFLKRYRKGNVSKSLPGPPPVLG